MELGFKKLTIDNWLEGDKTSDYFVWFSEEKQEFYKPSKEQRVEVFLEPTLDDVVPEEVKRLFEVARGCLLYGHFFYPMYTLGLEQLYRVLELAVTLKCTSINAPESINNFNKRIEYLIDNKIIPQSESISWHATRRLRNYSSHPSGQTILPPGEALRTLIMTTERINNLFGTEVDHGKAKACNIDSSN
ncbi:MULTISPECIES: hypothetical protein [Brevibacillus]|uniref:hypothetical protein n=1 Tax=Brevibacillus TaxID=55080 RepID=UPI000EDCC4A1|nr:hypothetical protein [Brevibacillus sp.]HBZ82756.1 hypothetical protein [Brevibacillus sp.]